MRKFAQGTKVQVGKSRGEIDKLLRNWGATAIQWSDDYKRGLVLLRFIWTHKDVEYMARFSVQLQTLAEIEEEAKSEYSGEILEGRKKKLLADLGKQEHRLLLLWLKASLNAVEAGIIAPEVLFLPFFEGLDGRTVAEIAVPNLPKLAAGSADKLLALPGGKK